MLNILSDKIVIRMRMEWSSSFTKKLTKKTIKIAHNLATEWFCLYNPQSKGNDISYCSKSVMLSLNLGSHMVWVEFCLFDTVFIFWELGIQFEMNNWVSVFYT